jgi:hypothetical protein
MKEFIQIDKFRIRKSCIKKYVPMGWNQLNIYYSASRNKIDVEILKFKHRAELEKAVNTLDTHFIL